ncbi:MAG: hypothetical protein SFW09_10025 [Hyphomicrobiaceae bacterium]|nr:hypothetical protein [Hyphomicrobiaceae bacterium]
MGALGHYLESEGLTTAGISLIRLHSEKIRPPRALWVPFELGRPIGVPGDAPFQTRVLRALIDLLAEPAGPVLRDYPEDAQPGTAADLDGMVCPLVLARAASDDETLTARVRREVAGLEPWYEVSYRRRGRTTFGGSGLDLVALLGFLTTLLDGVEPPSPIEGQSVANALKLASEDLKAFYLEAMQAEPSPKPSRVLLDWFWKESAAGLMLAKVRDIGLASNDRAMRETAANHVVPRAYFAHFGITDASSASTAATDATDSA